MLTLVAAPVPELAVNPWVAIAVSAAFGGITVFLVRLAVRARRMKSGSGVDALVGHRASAMEPLTPEGHVLVEGEIWRAVADEAVARRHAAPASSATSSTCCSGDARFEPSTPADARARRPSQLDASRAGVQSVLK